LEVMSPKWLGREETDKGPKDKKEGAAEWCRRQTRGVTDQTHVHGKKKKMQAARRPGGAKSTGKPTPPMKKNSKQGIDLVPRGSV